MENNKQDCVAVPESRNDNSARPMQLLETIIKAYAIYTIVTRISKAFKKKKKKKDNEE